MDIKKGKLNVSIAIVFKIITMIMAVVVKMVLVDICGNEVNGLNALYISIIGVLSVAELGIGSAITFCMYKPIVEKNHSVVSALYGLFQKLYLFIGAVILCGGVALTPFLHLFAKDYVELNVNMYVTFLLILISVVATYLFSAKTSLINAYKNNYITTAITRRYCVPICSADYGFIYNEIVCGLSCLQNCCGSDAVDCNGDHNEKEIRRNH